MAVNFDDMRNELARIMRLATRDAAQRMREDLVQHTPHLRWRYGHDPRAPFPPHLRLDGTHVDSWADDSLAANPGAFPFVDRYYPGDHGGCQCDYDLVIGDRSYRTSSAWTSRNHDNGRRFTAEFQNRRYQPDQLQLPAARSRVARPGRAPVAVRSRAQVPAAVAFFHQDIITVPVFAAHTAISLARL